MATIETLLFLFLLWIVSWYGDHGLLMPLGFWLVAVIILVFRIKAVADSRKK